MILATSSCGHFTVQFVVHAIDGDMVKKSVSKPAPKRAKKPASQRPRKGRPQAWEVGVKTPLFSAKFRKMNAQSADMPTSVPFAMTTQLKPRFEVTKGERADSMVVRGIEPCSIPSFTPSGPVAQGTIVGTVSMNPLYICSARLREYALLHTKYLLKKARFMWIPRASLGNADNAGELMFSIERDTDQIQPLGTVVDYDDYFAREGSSAGPVFSTFNSEYKVTDLQTTYYVNPQSNSNGTDRRLTDQAWFYLITGSEFAEDTAALGLGRIYVEYEYHFYAPRTQSNPGGAYHLYSDSNATSTNLWGSTFSQNLSPAIYAEIVDGASELVVRRGHAVAIVLISRFAAPFTPTGVTYGFYHNITAAGTADSNIIVGEPGGTISDSSTGALFDTGAVTYIQVNTLGASATDYRLTINGANYGTTPSPSTWSAALNFVVAIEQGPSSFTLGGVRRFMQPAAIFQHFKEVCVRDDVELVGESVVPTPSSNLSLVLNKRSGFRIA